MVLMPDTETAHMDPFFRAVDHGDRVRHFSIRSRARSLTTAIRAARPRKAEAYMKAEGVGYTI